MVLSDDELSPSQLVAGFLKPGDIDLTNAQLYAVAVPGPNDEVAGQGFTYYLVPEDSNIAYTVQDDGSLVDNGRTVSRRDDLPTNEVISIGTQNVHGVDNYIYFLGEYSSPEEFAPSPPEDNAVDIVLSSAWFELRNLAVNENNNLFKEGEPVPPPQATLPKDLSAAISGAIGTNPDQGGLIGVGGKQWKYKKYSDFYFVTATDGEGYALKPGESDPLGRRFDVDGKTYWEVGGKYYYVNSYDGILLDPTGTPIPSHDGVGVIDIGQVLSPDSTQDFSSYAVDDPRPKAPADDRTDGQSPVTKNILYGQGTTLQVAYNADGTVAGYGQLVLSTGTKIDLTGMKLGDTHILQDGSILSIQMTDADGKELSKPIISIDDKQNTYVLNENGQFVSKDKKYLAVKDGVTYVSSQPVQAVRVGGKVYSLYAGPDGTKWIAGYATPIVYIFSGPNGGVITADGMMRSTLEGDGIKVGSGYFFANGAMYYKDGGQGKRCIDANNCIPVSSIAFTRHSIQEWQSKLRGYPGLNAFISEADPVIEDENMLAVLGGIPGWSGLICRAAGIFGVESSNSASGAAFSSYPGGSYAHIEATKYATYNFTPEGQETLYAVYKLTYDFHPVGSCKGKFNIYFFSGASKVALFSGLIDSDGNETGKYLRTMQPIVFDSTKDYDRVCMTFEDLSAECLDSRDICNIVQKGNSLTPSDIRTKEEQQTAGTDPSGITLNFANLG